MPAPVNLTAPVIKGDTHLGAVLYVDPGDWTDVSSLAFQWTRGGSNVSGATGRAYALRDADAGAQIAVVVTATNASGSTSATSAAVTAGAVVSQPSAGSGSGLVIPRLYVFGDSRAELNYNDNGFTGKEHRWTAQLAARLGAELMSPALGGTAASQQAGWTQPILKIPFVRTAGYLPAISAAIIQTGLNDLNYPSSIPTTQAAKVAMAMIGLRTHLSVARAARVWQNDDATGVVAYGGAGTWSSWPPNASWGGTAHRNPTVGGWVQMTVPADMPAGAVPALGFIVQPAAGLPGAGGNLLDLTVNGAAWSVPQLDMRTVGIANNASTLVTVRFPGVAAGSTIKATTNATSTVNTIFDACWVESNTPPLILVCSSYYLGPAASFGGVTSGDIDALNAVITSVVGEFDANVVLVDWEQVMLHATQYATTHRSDQIHPSELVQGQLADLHYKAIAANAAKIPSGPFSRERVKATPAAATALTGSPSAFVEVVGTDGTVLRIPAYPAGQIT